ncbi:error-prone DNA polymerase [Allorhizobium borbori]|uniref:Error-prone DNA polymerase n=1 Tax=Allorhizobium borbori TaxID=485907 RepID=A0A7W6P2U1_9HYPH|nr:error-prone DNA polymerase [Allorhizobium borbori]MBB4104196.1 error-prone DNA polymerase [Allorhizobium borbori]
MSDAPYAELQVTSHFSFLRGASSCEALFERARDLGLPALGIADRNTLAGIVRAHQAAKETGVRLVVGCRLDLADGMSVLVYPMDRPAYARLCRLLSLGKGRAGKGKCLLHFEDLAAYGEGFMAILVPDRADETTRFYLARMAATFGPRASMALTLRRRPNDQLRLHELAAMAAEAGVAPVVTNDVLYADPAQRMLQDVVTCIRHTTTIDAAGFRRERHADRYLKPPEEMQRLFLRYPQALARSVEILQRCRFSMDELAYQYPEEKLFPDLSPQEALEKLVAAGVVWRYPNGAPAKVQAALAHELALVRKLEYAPYFLTVNSIVRYAKSKDILCQGRGSAANSAICYVLGITAIDPAESSLLFERFISEDRREPPDIDVDFEHQRREEVIQWVYETYGRERAALCATVTRYRAKGALRDVGKALGLPEDVIRQLSSQMWGWSSKLGAAEAQESGLNLADPRIALTLELAGQLAGAPRHLSQHPGGFVLTRDRLDELVPIEPAAMADRQVIEWDKDDIDILKFMKVDVLALGMLSCMKRGFDLLAAHKGISVDLASIKQDDQPTYAMIRKADTIGVFQIESRAQMSMLPRLRPRKFYDLVIQVAIVRPGPIQGDMVHPYLRRRDGKEKPDYPRPEFEAVLERTLGVPIFQEQAMQVAIACAGFTANEADQLRRAMATFKNVGTIQAFHEKLVGGMVKNGYDRDFAERTFKQLEGFGSYGFPESHAASFAKIAYASSWLKCHHPDVFCAALLNAQPMGFYAPAQIVRDAQAHGVEVRPVSINKSRWDCTLEPSSKGGGLFAVRLGFRMVRGLSNEAAAALVNARVIGPYRSIDDLWRRVRLAAGAMEALASADAFQPAFNLSRREALWALKGLRDEPLPLFAAATEREASAFPEQDEPEIALRPMTAGGEVVEDYGHVGLTLRAHPLTFLREDLRQRRFVPCADAVSSPDRRWVKTAGLVLVRQRPGSAKGVIFVTIEDETGIANLVVWPKIFEKFRRIVLGSGMLGVSGRLQREGEVVHIVARELFDLSADLLSVGQRDTPFRQPFARADEFRNGPPRDDPRGLARYARPAAPASEEAIRVRSRDFH